MTSIWLMYHDIWRHQVHPAIPHSSAVYHISEDAFQAHLQVIQQSNKRITTITGFNDDPTADSVVLTFDDGWRGAFEYGIPALESLGLKGTFFITRDYVGQKHFCDESMIASAAQQGMEIGLHGTTHRMLSACTPEEIVDEFAQCKAYLENIIGYPVTAASLPGGDLNQTIIESAKAVGIKVLCTSVPGKNHASTNPYRYRRIAIKTSTSVQDLQRYGRFNTSKESIRWAGLQLPRKLLGMRTYSLIRRKLMDRRHDKEHIFEL